MALTDEMLRTIQAQIASQQKQTVLRGNVQDISPTVTVLVDGTYQAIAVMFDDEYIPTVGDRVYVIQLGTDWVLVGKVVPIGGIPRPSMNGGYVEAYIPADNVWGASFLQGTLAINQDVSDPGWTLSGGSNFFLVPPSNTKGIWRMSVSMRWQSSTASVATSWRYVEGVTSDQVSPFATTRRTTAQTHGHVANVEQNLHGISKAFPLTSSRRLGMNFGSSTANNSAFWQSWVGSGGTYATDFATYLTAWRVR